MEISKVLLGFAILGGLLGGQKNAPDLPSYQEVSLLLDNRCTLISPPDSFTKPSDYLDQEVLFNPNLMPLDEIQCYIEKFISDQTILASFLEMFYTKSDGIRYKATYGPITPGSDKYVFYEGDADSFQKNSAVIDPITFLAEFKDFDFESVEMVIGNRLSNLGRRDLKEFLDAIGIDYDAAFKGTGDVLMGYRIRYRAQEDSLFIGKQTNTLEYGFAFAPFDYPSVDSLIYADFALLDIHVYHENYAKPETSIRIPQVEIYNQYIEYESIRSKLWEIFYQEDPKNLVSA